MTTVTNWLIGNLFCLRTQVNYINSNILSAIHWQYILPPLPTYLSPSSMLKNSCGYSCLHALPNTAVTSNFSYLDFDRIFYFRLWTWCMSGNIVYLQHLTHICILCLLPVVDAQYKKYATNISGLQIEIIHCHWWDDGSRKWYWV